MNFQNWLVNQGSLLSGKINNDQYAIMAWGRILRKPTMLVIRRDGINLAAQKIRIEHDSREVGSRDETGFEVYEQRVIVYGVKDHPDSGVLDTNIKAGDTFVVDSQRYTVEILETSHPGEIRARAKVAE